MEMSSGDLGPGARRELADEPTGVGPEGHRGFRRVFGGAGLTLGLFFAIESYAGAVPSMRDQLELAVRAEEVGFAALWVRDVPLLDPSFGDAGQVFDPWVYLGQVAAATQHVALATGGIVLPLRHPLHVAKAAASVDVLSGGRFLLGVAGGDRPVEYPAFGVGYADRAERFREAVALVRVALGESFPRVSSSFGVLGGDVDVIPKPTGGRLPLLAVGSAGQTNAWLAANVDGLVSYPRPPAVQRRVVDAWGLASTCAPFAQSLYVDLVADAGRAPSPIHLGHRLGAHRLVEVLDDLRGIGVRHVVLNLKYGSRPAAAVLEDIGTMVLPKLA